MLPLLNKIDKALESKAKCTLVDKMGKYLHGTISDSWAAYSGGRVRGKVVFESEEKGQIEMDVNDILDILFAKG